MNGSRAASRPGPEGGCPVVRSVAVVGLGLIGGSLARDLAAQGLVVHGYDPDPATLDAACAAGAVHRPLDASLGGVGGAEVLVIAVPVAAAAEVLATAVPHLGGIRLVTDVGSTKRGIARAAERLGVAERFVGGHPLAGDHRSGWPASRTNLFRASRVFLCPTPRTRPEAVEMAEALWTTVGARPELLGPEEHDRRLAWTSHLPQAVSTALARALAEAGVPPEELGPGGRDTTRLAASSPALWSGIARENADALDDALASLEAQLGQLRAALAGADPEAVERFFSEGADWAGRSVEERS